MIETPAFEDYPRRQLSLRVGRRQMFLNPVIASRVREGQSLGAGVFSFASLGILADELLGLLTPSPSRGCRFGVQGGMMCVSVEGATLPRPLFPADLPASDVLLRFDGLTRIDEIARDLSKQQNWDPGRGFAYARGVFLHLISLGLCLPYSASQAERSD